jgi:hypothetical protein
VLAMTLITLIYFIVADWIYIARLAGYVCITEMPDAAPEPIRSLRPMPASGTSAPGFTPTDAAVDRNELILSDLPNSDMPNSDLPNLVTES